MHEDPAVAAILEAYYARREAGEAPDPKALIRAHPVHADALEAHFAAVALVEEAFKPACGGEGSPRLGDYVLEAELGHGVMGTVYRARVEGRLAGAPRGAVVALKVLHPHLLQAPAFFKRFLGEARTGMAVHHPNVVRTLDADAVLARGDLHHFLVMEYVEGQTLRFLLDERGRIDEELAVHVAVEVARGLEAIHAAGAVHRDLKPENVLLMSGRAVKLMDLGVARLAVEALQLARAQGQEGSLAYAAPELLAERGDPVDGRADLFSLGVLLYELASGTHPFAAAGGERTVRRILRETPRRLGERIPGVSSHFEDIVHTLLEKEREARFTSATDLLVSLSVGR